MFSMKMIDVKRSGRLKENIHDVPTLQKRYEIGKIGMQSEMRIKKTTLILNTMLWTSSQSSSTRF